MRSNNRRRLRFAISLPVIAALSAVDARGIEMFTFFGDGSRIGLPSLEVPVEAYPGIPLRSDRLRARRRAMRAGPGASVPVGPPGQVRGVTIRAMPPLGEPAAPAAGRVLTRRDLPAMPPEPEDVTAEPRD